MQSGLNQEEAGYSDPPMPPIWIANLDRSPERREYMQTQIDTFGLEAEFIAAIDGLQLDPDELDLYSRRRAMLEKKRELQRCEIGTSLTHLRMYERIISEGIDEVLILEDDVHLSPDFLEIVAARHRLPADWEIINFADTQAVCRPIDGAAIFKNYRVGRFIGIANRTGAYLINRRGAEKLLRAGFPIRRPSDDLLGRTEITGVHLYGVTPPVVTLADIESDVWAVSTALEDLARPSPFLLLPYRFFRKLWYMIRRPHRAFKRK